MKLAKVIFILTYFLSIIIHTLLMQHDSLHSCLNDKMTMENWHVFWVHSSQRVVVFVLHLTVYFC